MTSQGSAHGRFTRAIQRGNLRSAEMAARELRALGSLALGDAFALCLLLAVENDPRIEPALVKWHGRFELEAKSLAIAESQLVLAALAALPGESAEEVVKEIARRRGIAVQA